MVLCMLQRGLPGRYLCLAHIRSPTSGSPLLWFRVHCSAGLALEPEHLDSTHPTRAVVTEMLWSESEQGKGTYQAALAAVC